MKNPQSWGVQFKALFLRCITEFSNSRKAERALQQLESLSLDYTKENPKGCSRQHLIQAVDLDPMWEHQVSFRSYFIRVFFTYILRKKLGYFGFYTSGKIVATFARVFILVFHGIEELNWSCIYWKKIRELLM